VDEMTKPLALLVIAVSAFAACQKLGRSPASPSDVVASAQDVAVQWSPYVGVHSTALALAAYQDALPALQRAGQLQGVRMEIRPGEPVDPVIKAVGALGLEVLGLVSNEYLVEPDLEGAIDRILRAYPEIWYFQIGNEITTLQGGPTMTIEEYASVFQGGCDHVQARYPGRAILLTQSALGSGLRGPTELAKLADLAVSRMDPDKVIVAINAYDPDGVSQYSGVLGGKLRSFRVWVTESGMANPDRQAAFVRDKYPLLRRYLRAERVYWYVMWGGDAGPDTGFSLVKDPANYPNYWKSPLFDLLVDRP